MNVKSTEMINECQSPVMPAYIRIRTKGSPVLSLMIISNYTAVSTAKIVFAEKSTFHIFLFTKRMFPFEFGLLIG